MPKTASGLALPGLFRDTVAVTDDGRGIAEHVITLLRQAGATAVRAQDVRAATDAPTATIFLGGLRADPEADAADARYDASHDLAITREAFQVARGVAGRGAFVTVGGLGRAGLGALARTCAREWSGVAVKAIELDQSDATSALFSDAASAAAAAIVSELLTGDSEPDVVLGLDGARSVRTMRPASLPVRPSTSEPSGACPPLTAASVVVITGGARGVTAACAQALARAFRPHIALIGRTPLEAEPPEFEAARSETELRAALVARAVAAGQRPRPAAIEGDLRRLLAAREVRSTLAGIAAAGSPVRYVRADVGDVESLRGALDEVRAQWGAISGVVHGAGVLADRLVVDKTDEQFDRVLRVKAEGFKNVLELVADDDPALVCVFSSVAASAGNAGQSDYAAANEISERLALAWRARHPACVVKAIAWGPWDGGMVSTELAAMFDERGVALIPLAAGAKAFVAELDDAPDAEAVGEVGAAAVPDDAVRCLITAQMLGDAEGGGFGAPASLPRGGEVSVSEVAQVWLGSHRIADRAVVPLAVVCDWMVRLVEGNSPGATIVLKDVDVVRGIVAPARVSVRRAASELAVVTDAGDVCYRARVGAGAPGVGSEPEVAVAIQDPAVFGEIYDGETLFHGAALRTLTRVDGISESGAVGSVVGAVEMEWPIEPWRIDPAALDGGIQLAVLWAKARIGCATLPMGVREARFVPGEPRPGALTCVVRRVSVGEQSAVCDVWLGPAGGGAGVVELRGLELVARPR